MTSNLPTPSGVPFTGTGSRRQRSGGSAQGPGFIDAEFKEVPRWKEALRGFLAGMRNTNWETSLWQLIPLFFILAAIAVILLDIEILWGAVLAFLICGFYFATRNVEIKSPDRGILFWRGKAQRRPPRNQREREDESLRELDLIEPSILLPLPLLARVQRIDMTERHVAFADQNILSGDRLGIPIGGVVRIEASPFHPDFLKVDEADVENLTEKGALAELQLRMTERDAMEWLQQKDVLSQLIAARVAKDLRATFNPDATVNDGVARVISVQLYDVDAHIISEPEALKLRGQATAKVAKLMRKALGKNAHKVQMVDVAGNVVKQIMESYYRERRRDRKEGVAGSAVPLPDALMEKLADMIVERAKKEMGS